LLLLLLYNQQWIDPSTSPQNPMTSMETKKKKKNKGIAVKLHRRHSSSNT